MAGEARKAAAQKAIDFMLDMRGSISRAARLEAMEAIFAEYAAETREQCAQIADKAQAKSEEEVREFRRLKLSGCAMQSQSEMSAFRTVAAAIRSIAQQDSANEGE